MCMPNAGVTISRIACRGPSSRSGLRALGAGVALVVAAVVGFAPLGWAQVPVDLVSANTKGNAANGPSSGPAASGDGNFVAFYSDASNLVAGDTNGVRDVFVRDRAGSVTERVSVDSSGAQANGPSQGLGGAPAISHDGDVVAFYSRATNLVSSDTNGQTDVFVRVRSTGTTELVSVASDGTQGNGASLNPSISADGRFVAFQSSASNLIGDDTNGVSDIFVRDRVSNTTERVCDGVQPNGASSSPSISADGTLVAFASAATNLVPGDTNGKLDIFVCNRSTGVIQRVSVSSSGAQGDGDSILPAISADGTVVGFKSLADNLVAGDTNGLVDVFVHDLSAGTTERVSVSQNGGNASDVSFPPSLSGDGRFVAFGSLAANLVNPDANDSSDVFVRDRKIGVTVLVDVNAQGQQANSGTPDIPPAISADGMQIAFASAASNLVANDNDDVVDVFARQNPFYGPNSCPDGTCPSGKVCSSGFCVTPTQTPIPTQTPRPTRTATPTITPTVTPTFAPCTSDSDCPTDYHCRDNFCKKDRMCTNQDRTACFDREACIGMLCECGGDCNLDGIVSGNEITKAVLILGGVLPLDQCSAADINGDGQVMGNEITQAVLNLGLGCVQESQPLIFAHDLGGMVTFTIGSTANADGTDTVTVDLSGGGGQAASAQIDLLVDPNVFDVGTPSATCTKDPRLTDDIFSATLPAAPPAPGGLQRVRLFVGDISAPIASFADGRIATCTFRLKPGATASAISADNLNVGDNQGNTFDTQAVSGTGTISLPSPTPGVGVAAACPGDCNGDGQVLSNEVTMAVRIMAGEEALSDCPAADADGDGKVFITDVTRAVISLGQGCPH